MTHAAFDNDLFLQKKFRKEKILVNKGLVLLLSLIKIINKGINQHLCLNAAKLKSENNRKKILHI